MPARIKHDREPIAGKARSNLKIQRGNYFLEPIAGMARSYSTTIEK